MSINLTDFEFENAVGFPQLLFQITQKKKSIRNWFKIKFKLKVDGVFVYVSEGGRGRGQRRGGGGWELWLSAIPPENNDIKNSEIRIRKEKRPSVSQFGIPDTCGAADVWIRIFAFIPGRGTGSQRRWRWRRRRRRRRRTKSEKRDEKKEGRMEENGRKWRMKQRQKWRFLFTVCHFSKSFSFFFFKVTFIFFVVSSLLLEIKKHNALDMAREPTYLKLKFTEQSINIFKWQMRQRFTFELPKHRLIWNFSFNWYYINQHNFNKHIMM